MQTIRCALVAVSLLVAGSALADKNSCKKARHSEEQRYMKVAEAYNKACEGLKAKNVLAPFVHQQKGVICGYLGAKSEPGKDKAQITDYFAKAKSYSAACNAMKKQKALSTGTMSGVDCGYMGVAGGWTDCPDVK